MTDDEPGNDSGDDDRGGGGRRGGGSGGGGGGGGLGSILALLVFFFRHPKLSLVLLAIFGLVYVFGGEGGSSKVDESVSHADVTLGATLDPKVYDEALVHEPLAEPESADRVSLLEFAPSRRSQGRQGSCVGWATSYAARTILHAKQTGRPGDELPFSPSYAYNPVAKPGCHGTYLVRALERLRDVGDLPLREFDYDERSCDAQPDADEDDRAKAYKIAGFTRLSLDADDYRTNADAVRQHLAQGAPVVIGMRVGGTFESPMNGRSIWHPTEDDYDEKGDWGGHAMAVIGYDDGIEGGAFELMNSWGDDWGKDGVAWVRYKDFDHFVKEAYGLYPMRAARAADTAQRIRFGLTVVDAKGRPTGKRLAFEKASGLAFRTTAPIRKGTRFKVEFSNSRPVYTYLFGQETDGTSYVLFPYTPKHSPYCGTTGTRVFPRQQSLTADATGTRDAVAVVISPKALDPKELNARITAQPGADYAEKLAGALGDSISTKSRTRVAKDLVELTSSGADGDRVDALVLEFDKE